ncbi:transferase [Oculatella sp. LEGE 06141]|uniref:transferase n=2 Tax=Oculatella sp. LEGE 06141 TaxID=1828648 RepID=UPI00187F440C|nr:transferase [Oculatella sp. LEGE 06141]MBE9177738.1 transferase [Oculatella sp. LEGE 06141]
MAATLTQMSEFHFYISGDVTIHPEAAIAADVVLQADPNSQLIIAAGACIGSGTVLHAQQGTLEIEASATLGAKVLVVGNGRIGKSACIGSQTTIINCSVEAEQVISANSLLGDTSYQLTESTTDPAHHPTSSHPPKADTASNSDQAGTLSESRPAQVYGQASFNRMMVALFPTRQSSNNLSPFNPSSDGDT